VQVIFSLVLAAATAAAKPSIPAHCTKMQPVALAFAPFGAGQFMTCRYVVGGVLAALEGASLQFWYSKKKEADDATTAINQYQEQYRRSEETVPHTEDDDVKEKKYVQDATRYIESTRRTSNQALYLFVGLWVGGVVESFLDKPKAPKVEPDEQSALRFRPVLTPGRRGVALSYNF
jgi:hypothetical protein